MDGPTPAFAIVAEVVDARADQGGDPACWAHLFPFDSEITAAPEVDPKPEDL